MSKPERVVKLSLSTCIVLIGLGVFDSNYGVNW